MSLSDPADPLPILRAMKELGRRWKLLAERDDFGTGEPDADPYANPWEMTEAQLLKRYGSFDQAVISVFRFAVLSLKIRVWIEDGANWKRPTIHTVQEYLPPQSGLIVDQEEVRRVLRSRWPKAFPIVDHEPTWPIRAPAEASSAIQSADEEARSVAPAKRKLGRPKGLGYSLKDVRVFQMILDVQRESGDVENQHAVINKLAHEADGASFQAKVDRLRRGLPKWLERNGLEWVRSK